MITVLTQWSNQFSLVCLVRIMNLKRTTTHIWRDWNRRSHLQAASYSYVYDMKHQCVCIYLKIQRAISKALTWEIDVKSAAIAFRILSVSLVAFYWNILSASISLLVRAKGIFLHFHQFFVFRNCVFFIPEVIERKLYDFYGKWSTISVWHWEEQDEGKTFLTITN